MDRSSSREIDLAAAFEHATVGVSISRPDGGFVRVNRAYCGMLGYSAEELLRSDILAVTHPEDREATRQAMAALLSGDGDSYRLEKRYQRKDGTTVWAEVKAWLVRDDAGRPMHFVADVTDATERKEMEAELHGYRQHLEKLVAARTRELAATQARLSAQERLVALGQLTGGIAHEVRNPLAVIRNAVYLLKKSQAQRLDADGLRQLGIIDAEITRGDRIIETLLDYARGRRGEPQPCSVRELVHSACWNSALPARVSVAVTVADTTPAVMVDDGQVERALVNLLSNAAQAMPGGGVITVTCEPDDGQVRIVVADNGHGVRPEDLGRVFDPMFTTKRVGTGLGLAICRAFVEANGGTVSVESEPGEGARFTVRLPAAGP